MKISLPMEVMKKAKGNRLREAGEGLVNWILKTWLRK
jgi:hypothetical protein